MTEAGSAHPGTLTLLWELVTGRRAVERSGPLLRAFRRLPGPLRDAARWTLRPRRRFLLGRLRALAADHVMSGPFGGMRLAGLPAAQELLGTYEHELFDTVHALARGPYRTVVNVGARNGYYAVGLARLMPNARERSSRAADGNSMIKPRNGGRENKHFHFPSTRATPRNFPGRHRYSQITGARPGRQRGFAGTPRSTPSSAPVSWARMRLRAAASSMTGRGTRAARWRC